MNSNILHGRDGTKTRTQKDTLNFAETINIIYLNKTTFIMWAIIAARQQDSVAIVYTIQAFSYAQKSPF